MQMPSIGAFPLYGLALKIESPVHVGRLLGHARDGKDTQHILEIPFILIFLFLNLCVQTIKTCV